MWRMHKYLILVIAGALVAPTSCGVLKSMSTEFTNDSFGSVMRDIISDMQSTADAIDNIHHRNAHDISVDRIQSEPSGLYELPEIDISSQKSEKSGTIQETLVHQSQVVPDSIHLENTHAGFMSTSDHIRHIQHLIQSLQQQLDLLSQASPIEPKPEFEQSHFHDEGHSSDGNQFTSSHSEDSYFTSVSHENFFSPKEMISVSEDPMFETGEHSTNSQKSPGLFSTLINIINSTIPHIQPQHESTNLDSPSVTSMESISSNEHSSEHIGTTQNEPEIPIEFISDETSSGISTESEFTIGSTNPTASNISTEDKPISGFHPEMHTSSEVLDSAIGIDEFQPETSNEAGEHEVNAMENVQSIGTPLLPVLYELPDESKSSNVFAPLDTIPNFESNTKTDTIVSSHISGSDRIPGKIENTPIPSETTHQQITSNDGSEFSNSDLNIIHLHHQSKDEDIISIPTVLTPPTIGIIINNDQPILNSILSPDGSETHSSKSPGNEKDPHMEFQFENSNEKKSPSPNIHNPTKITFDNSHSSSTSVSFSNNKHSSSESTPQEFPNENILFGEPTFKSQPETPVTSSLVFPSPLFKNKNGNALPHHDAKLPIVDQVPQSSEHFPQSTAKLPKKNPSGRSDGSPSILAQPSDQRFDQSKPKMLMPYDFQFDVFGSENNFYHKETSDGKTTRGEYSVLLPDGKFQIVKFHDDGNGYKVDISYA